MLRERYPRRAASPTSSTPRGRPPEYFRLLPDDVASAILERELLAPTRGIPPWHGADAFLDCLRCGARAEVTRTPAPARPRQATGHVTEVAGAAPWADADELRQGRQRNV